MAATSKEEELKLILKANTILTETIIKCLQQIIKFNKNTDEFSPQVIQVLITSIGQLSWEHMYASDRHELIRSLDKFKRQEIKHIITFLEVYAEKNQDSTPHEIYFLLGILYGIHGDLSSAKKWHKLGANANNAPCQLFYAIDLKTQACNSTKYPYPKKMIPNEAQNSEEIIEHLKKAAVSLPQATLTLSCMSFFDYENMEEIIKILSTEEFKDNFFIYSKRIEFLILYYINKNDNKKISENFYHLRQICKVYPFKGYNDAYIGNIVEIFLSNNRGFEYYPQYTPIPYDSKLAHRIIEKYVNITSHYVKEKILDKLPITLKIYLNMIHSLYPRYKAESYEKKIKSHIAYVENNPEDLEATFRLGRRYLWGDEADICMEQALALINKAADNGHKQAIYYRAYYYYRPYMDMLGTTPPPNEAEKFYKDTVNALAGTKYLQRVQKLIEIYKNRNNPVQDSNENEDKKNKKEKLRC